MNSIIMYRLLLYFLRQRRLIPSLRRIKARRVVHILILILRQLLITLNSSFLLFLFFLFIIFLILFLEIKSLFLITLPHKLIQIDFRDQNIITLYHISICILPRLEHRILVSGLRNFHIILGVILSVQIKGGSLRLAHRVIFLVSFFSLHVAGRGSSEGLVVQYKFIVYIFLV